MTTIIQTGLPPGRTPNEYARILANGQGIKGEVYPRQVSRTTGALIDGTVYFMGCGFRGGETVTNVVVDVMAAAANITLSKVGIASVSGTTYTRQGISADQGTAWQAAGAYTIALTTPYTIPTEGMYYLVVVAKATTTLPSMIIAGGFGGTGPHQIGTNPFVFGIQTGQTDIPASGTVVVGAGVNPWLGWS